MRQFRLRHPSLSMFPMMCIFSCNISLSSLSPLSLPSLSSLCLLSLLSLSSLSPICFCVFLIIRLGWWCGLCCFALLLIFLTSGARRSGQFTVRQSVSALSVQRSRIPRCESLCLCHVPTRGPNHGHHGRVHLPDTLCAGTCEVSEENVMCFGGGGLTCTGVVWCDVGVVWCGVVVCCGGGVWCVWCCVRWCGVLCCVVLWCVVLCCGAMWCDDCTCV